VLPVVPAPMMTKLYLRLGINDCVAEGRLDGLIIASALYVTGSEASVAAAAAASMRTGWLRSRAVPVTAAVHAAAPKSLCFRQYHITVAMIVNKSRIWGAESETNCTHQLVLSSAPPWA
jgi:hypothetical protein